MENKTAMTGFYWNSQRNNGKNQNQNQVLELLCSIHQS